jgi:hypothetical protein
MSDREEKLNKILEKIKASGKLDPEDLKDFTPLEKDLIEKLFYEGSIKDALKMLTGLDPDKDLEIVKRKLDDFEKTVVPLWKSVLKYAAIIIGVITFSYYFQMKDGLETNSHIVENYIKLKTGDDRIQLINQEKSQDIVSASGELIGRQEGSKINYLADSKINELIYNELQIPNGKVFNLELSDGTIVNLNSGTKIKYPIKFLKGKKREVFIDGEAYFNVAKDKEHPFIVNAENLAVTVLGTKFNISSYKEDPEIVTVLVEGSVNITTMAATDADVVLKPGMKGSWQKSEHSIATDNVDTNLYVAWMRGELIFKNSNFSTMAKTLERKYNVTIENKNKTLAEKVLTANFNTNIESIEEVLKVIGEIHPFNYIIKNQHILIVPQNQKSMK